MVEFFGEVGAHFFLAVEAGPGGYFGAELVEVFVFFGEVVRVQVGQLREAEEVEDHA